MYTYRILFLLMIVPSALIATMIAVTSKETRAMREDKAVTQWVADLPRPENQTLDGILFTPDGAFLVAIGFDRDKKQGVVHFWEIERRKLVRTLVEPDAVAAAAFTPDGKRLVTACWDSKMRIYSCDNWKLEHSFDYDPPGQTANHLAMLSDGKRFVSGNVGYQGPRIWDLEKSSAVSLAAPRETVCDIAVSKEGRQFAIAYSAPIAEIWDSDKLEVIGKLRMETKGAGGPQGVFTSLALSPDGKTIATGCIALGGAVGKNALRIWDAKTYKLMYESDKLDEYPVRILYTPDSKLIVSNIGPDPQSQGKILLWEVTTGKIVYTIQAGRHSGMLSALSPDGHWLLTCSSSPGTRIRLWDFAKIRQEIGK